MACSGVTARRGMFLVLWGLAVGPAAGLAADRGADVVDATTLAGKVMCGYQGWFRCPGDATKLGWVHWSGNPHHIAPDTLTFDLWPDTSELAAADRFLAPGFTMDAGSPAYLFSSDSPRVVLRHFQWMRDYGLDGAWVQHFLVGLPGGPFPLHYPSHRRVIQDCVEAAEKTGRVWAISYDVAAMPTEKIYATLTADWKKMVDEGIIGGGRYLHHGRQPVVQIWGFYWNNADNRITAEVAGKLIDFFQTPGRYAALLVGGGDWNWRRNPDPQWQGFCRRFKAYAPWNVGNFSRDKAGVEHASTQCWAEDLQDCRRRGVLWIPVVYPGFSWQNLMRLRHVSPVTTIPRRGGEFFWEQFYALAKLKVDCAYVAMFDEVDEGTAIFKLATDSHVQGPVVHREKGYPSDWYLRVAGAGAKMLHGQRPLTAKIPIEPK